ncbi:MAG TPA: hypothetical protein VHT34_06235, partial [Clostridia bacterium]|nr:hypothetical protein [Clostridia bacterium]
GAKTQSCSDAFAISKNQAPQVSNINTKLNSDGSLTINFSANDPEGQLMNAECFIVDSNGNDFSWSKNTKVTPSSAKFQNGMITVTFLQSVLNANLSDGTSYKVRVDLYDSQGLKTQGYSDDLKWNSIPAYSGTNTLIIENKVNFGFTACVYYNSGKIKEVSVGVGGSTSINNLPDGSYYIIYVYGNGNTFKGNSFTLDNSCIYRASLEYAN